jgi:predicted HD superfamily hydrolase involved in NAD metabolism
MNPYDTIIISERTGDLRSDMQAFLSCNGHAETAAHCLRVGEQAAKIAEMYNVNVTSALYAGYLHDISAVYPNEVRINAARALDIEVLQEEEVFPMIIHQKLSRQMAQDLFRIDDPMILDAVGCHTTLRKNSTMLDRVLFVADKIAWDQAGDPPYLSNIRTALDRSIEHAAFTYIDYLWSRRETLKVVHPWLRDAYEELKRQLMME